ncbi:SDR family NAD(P)-dependent oxidoreductase [Rhodopseudomonas palustris]|uniref:SDR family NAD(P)-dependent oxidoreductase n=1 Tax=Rhodopseudomonas palustris TaxID=1076 RepID=UPI000642682D|nr:SDR family oxidoreductase [Rhodopseudomonas palustris]
MTAVIDQRVVLITGMSRGFGECLARHFWRAGADLFGVARDGDALGRIAADLATDPVRPGQRVATMAADLASAAAAPALIARCLAEFGRLDVLVCNAAIQGPIGPFHEQDIDAWEATVAADLVAPVRLVHAALPRMRAAGGDRSILFLSGGGATGPRPGFSAYAAAKTALVRFAETLAVELAGTGISVNCISPGAMPTAMLAEVAAAGAVQAGAKEIEASARAKDNGAAVMQTAARLAVFLAGEGHGITGKLIAAQWDRWEDWPAHLDELKAGDLYTLRRITGRDRGIEWGDK